MFKLITKKNNLVVIIITFFLFSFTLKNNTYQTECVSIETNGYITLKIWDSKKGFKYNPEQAKKDAVHAMLYAGIAGTNGCTTQRAILSNAETIDQFKKIEKDFFSKNGEWQRFTRSSDTETTLPETIGAKNWKVYQVSVAKDALRKYLEEKQIIKSLNNGF